jgi:hypothetical protein
MARSCIRPRNSVGMWLTAWTRLGTISIWRESEPCGHRCGHRGMSHVQRCGFWPTLSLCRE